jgi:hypothetical protein
MPRLISVMRAKVVPWTSIIASSRGPNIGAAARQSNRARRDARAGPKRSEARQRLPCGRDAPAR